MASFACFTAGLALSLALSGVSGQCYSPQGTKMLTDFNPCYNSGTPSFCCATQKTIIDHNSTEHDKCLPNGLCQSVEHDGSTGYWRVGCSDPSWPSAYCLSIFMNTNQEDSNKVAALTPCDNTATSKTWCHGHLNTSCCGKGAPDEVTIAPTLAGFAAATSSPTSSTSTSSSIISSTTPSDVPATTTGANTTGAALGSSPSLSSGAKVGIGVGVGLGVAALLISLATLILIMRKKRATRTPTAPAAWDQPQGYADTRHDTYSAQPHYQESRRGIVTAGGESTVVEAGGEQRSELHSPWEPAEVEGKRVPVELEVPQPTKN
ncbi:hypothetical protein K461DRAFT_282237 [Myriangium duriaei CBS 260.36]|uniref:Mid2 domain-containing protein n=1 Tax=Myriangium duriaei CBS 260.36 TaxID=1168546 RepID=A0A9P4IUP8_9PEZI|nr:hypothetical protein K461DRAFT_282237 [Myriangium duriaei CBS 260.36]